MWDKGDERVKDENMQGISFLRSCRRRVIISEHYSSGSAFMHVRGEWEGDAEVRLVKWMSFKVLDESRGSGVVVVGVTIISKILRVFFNKSWLVKRCSCHGTFWAHHTPPRPSCHRSCPPGYRLGLRAGRRAGFCSGRAGSEGTGALLRLETHKKLLNTTDKKQLRWKVKSSEAAAGGVWIKK